MRQPRALRDLRPGHPLHQSKDERFAIRLRKGTDQGQNHVSLQLGCAVGCSALGLILGNGLGGFLDRNRLAEEAISWFPVDGPNHAPKRKKIRKRMNPSNAKEENSL